MLEAFRHRGVDILGICEHRRPNQACAKVGDWLCLQSGASGTNTYEGGVSLYLSPRAAKGWETLGKEVEYIHPRLLRVRLLLGGKKVTIFVVYVAPLDSIYQIDSADPWDDAARSQTFNMLSDQLETVPSGDVTLIIGDMNSHVGASPAGSHI